MRTLIVCALLLTTGCPPKVVRNLDTFQVETMASLARQQEAADALFAAAAEAQLRGDAEQCRAYAGPALLIEAYAANQANRALWLAGVTDGEDPGPSPEPRPVAAVCGEEE